jgi:hypothetical protein
MAPYQSNDTEKHSAGQIRKGLVDFVKTLILFLLFIIPFQAGVSAQGKRVSHPKPNTQSHRHADKVIESGRFRIYELNQVQGDETYEIRRNNAGPTTSSLIVTAEINLPFMGEEQKPRLSATLRAKGDLTPESFQIKGVRPLKVAVDTSSLASFKVFPIQGNENCAKSGGTLPQIKPTSMHPS